MDLESAALSALPAVEGVDREQIAERYAAVVPKLLASIDRQRVVVGIVAAIIVFAGGIPLDLYVAESVQQAPHGAAIVATTVYATVLLGFGAIPNIVIYRASIATYSLDLTAKRTVISVVQPLLSILTVTYALAPFCFAVFNLSRAELIRTEYSGTAIFVALLTRDYGEALGRYREYKLAHTSPPVDQVLDRVAAQMVTIAVHAQSCAVKFEYVDRRRVRRLISALEHAAKDAERFAVAQAPWLDGRSRRAARQAGLQLASVIRAHKQPLLIAVREEDFAKVARSLMFGLAAWCRGDFAALVEHAPIVAAPSGLRRLMARLGAAVLLATAAIVLPLVPPLDLAEQAASGVRASLLITAVIALATGAVQAPEYIRSVVDRAIVPSTPPTSSG